MMVMNQIDQTANVRTDSSNQVPEHGSYYYDVDILIKLELICNSYHM